MTRRDRPGTDGKVVDISGESERAELALRRRIASLDVIACLPDRFHPLDGSALPPDLIGATIVRFGTVEPHQMNLEGGGLVIDYRPLNQDVVMRAVFEFTELGMDLLGVVSIAPSRI